MLRSLSAPAVGADHDDIAVPIDNEPWDTIGLSINEAVGRCLRTAA